MALKHHDFIYITIVIKSQNDSINTIKKQILLNFLLIH